MSQNNVMAVEGADFAEIVSYKGNSRWYRRADHFYKLIRTVGNTRYFACHSHLCPVTFQKRNDALGDLNGEHDHLPTPWVPNRNAMFQSLKRRSGEESIPLISIYEEEALRFPDAAPHLSFDSVQSTMRSQRRRLQPSVPRSLAQYAEMLARIHNLKYMLFATVSTGSARAVILAMRGFRECLNASDTVVVDGTFLTVPAGPPAAQILTIHCVINGNFFHPFFCLMENRRQALYEEVLSRIWQAAGNPRPRHIISDFEIALQKALTNVTGVVVQGCYFHFLQALLRRAKLLGVNVRRTTTHTGWKAIQLYGALALLPPHLIREGLALVPGIMLEKGWQLPDDFHSYFESYWIEKVGPETLSVYGKPHRTTNLAESFHATLRRSLGPNPSIWRFTDIVHQKFNICQGRLDLQINDQLRPRRNRQRHYIRTKLLARYQDQLEMQQISVRQYLVNISSQMTTGIVVGDEPLVIEELDIGAEVIVGQDDEEEEVAVYASEPNIGTTSSSLTPSSTTPSASTNHLPSRLPACPRPVCRVCSTYEANKAMIPCGHVMCPACVSQLQLGAKCPLCGQLVSTSIPISF